MHILFSRSVCIFWMYFVNLQLEARKANLFLCSRMYIGRELLMENKTKCRHQSCNGIKVPTGLQSLQEGNVTAVSSGWCISVGISPIYGWRFPAVLWVRSANCWPSAVCALLLWECTFCLVSSNGQQRACLQRWRTSFCGRGEDPRDYRSKARPQCCGTLFQPTPLVPCSSLIPLGYLI